MSEGIKPTLAELEKFEEQTEGMDIECILSDTLPPVFGLCSLAPPTRLFSKTFFQGCLVCALVVCVCVCFCVCVSVCVHTCMWVWVCVRERERERE